MAGSRSLGTLTVDLVAKIAGFEQGMNKAERELDKRAKRMNDIAKKIGTGLGTAITVGIAGAAAAASGLALLTKNAIDNADAIRDLSIRVGVSTETLSAYGYAASQTGTDIETLGKGLKVLAKNAADSLNPTSEQAKVFEALGVKATDANGKLKQMSQLVPEIADKFKQLEDGTTKAALAQALFGRAGLDLTEFLNQGSDGIDEFTEKAARLGVVIDSETATAADDFNDQLGDLSTLVSGLGLQVAKELLPRLNDLVESLTDVVKEGGAAAKIADVIGTSFDAAATAAKVTSATFKGVAYDLTAITLAAVAAGKALGRDFLGAASFLKQAADFRKMAAAESDKIGQAFGPDFSNVTDGTERWKNVVGGSSTSGGVDAAAIASALSNPTATKGGSRSKQLSDEEKEAKRLLETYQRLTATYDERIVLFGKEGEAAKVRYDIEFGELSKLSPAQKADLLDRAERLDLMGEELELQQKIAAEDQRRLDSYTDVMQAIKEQTQLVGLSWEQQEIWNNLKWAGVDADSDWVRQIIASTKALQEQREAMEDQIEIMDGARDGARTFFDDLRDGVGVIDSLKDAFGRFADALYDWATNSLIDQFFGKQGTSGNGTAGGGWLSSLFGSTGSSQGSLFDLFSGAWGFAGGGTMPAYSMARVNELGVEMATVGGNDYLLTGRRPAEITPHHQIGGGGSITQNFITNGTETRRTREEKARRSGLEAQRALMRTGR